MIYVGKNHAGFIQTLLTKVPFPDVQLVLMSQKHQTPDIFAKQLQLHHALCATSRAIKLRHTSEDFRLALAHEIREDETVGEHIIDVAAASSTESEGTLYIQCLGEQKPNVQDYVQDFIKAYASKHPNDAYTVK